MLINDSQNDAQVVPSIEQRRLIRKGVHRYDWVEHLVAGLAAWVSVLFELVEWSIRRFCNATKEIRRKG